MTTTQLDGPKAGRRADGPNAGVLGIVVLALTMAGVLVPTLLAGGGTIPSPLGSTADVAGYYSSHPAAATVAGFFTFGAAIPLGILAATIYARQLKLGVRVPGPGISFYGGIAASVFVGSSGLITWTLGQGVTGRSAALVHTLAYLGYALGGVGFVTAVGLLIAGIAVPAVILGLVPRWLGWTGLIVAAIAELGFLSLLIPSFSIALPIGRFVGLAWLLVIGFLLPKDRHEVSRGSGR